MNIPQTFLVEPYNAYTSQPGGRKKHWHEIVEEQALLQRIIQDQQAQQAIQEATSHTLPPNSPSIASATVAGNAAGAGGMPTPQFFNPNMVVSYTTVANINNLTGSAPCGVNFLVGGNSDLIALSLINFNWNFGSGSSGTGGGLNPSYLYSSTGSFRTSMTASAISDPSNKVSSSVLIKIIPPTVTAGFTATDGNLIPDVDNNYTASSNDVINFINASYSNNASNPFTYNWNFRSGSTPTSTLQNPVFTFTTASSYVVTLGVTGSFGITSSVNHTFKIT